MTDVLNGFKAILMGPTGTGKTTSIHTLVETGLHVHYVPLESRTEPLIGYWTDKGEAVPDNLHICRVQQAQASFLDIIEAAKQTMTLPHDAVMKMPDKRKSKYTGYINLLTACHAFVDERTGEKFEPADTWGTDRVLVVDGLTGLGEFAMANAIGGRVERTQTDWGVGQGYVMSFIRKVTDGCQCHFVLLAHVEREVDAILGGVKLMPATLGKAINGLVPTKFSDVIYARKEVDKFSWSTAESQVDVKNCNLPLSSKLDPSFVPLYEKWLSRASGARGSTQ
jgi:AAA domain